MKNETVVVTGSSAGLGRAVAHEFGRHGAQVALLARGIDGLEGAKREIEAAGGKAERKQFDVRDLCSRYLGAVQQITNVVDTMLDSRAPA